MKKSKIFSSVFGIRGVGVSERLEQLDVIEVKNG